jgi:hypothetical protein
MPTFTIASEKQLAFLDDIIRMREIPELMKMSYVTRRSVLAGKDASDLISTFLKYPLLSTAETSRNFAADNGKMKELMELVEGVPQGKYAIPAEELMMDLLKRPIKNNLVFCELKEYRGRMQFRQLHGAPGSFSRSMFPVEDALVFAKRVKTDPYKYTRIFADHHKCCGRCGAELTDQTSRETRLGPTCRSYFGK